MEWVEEPWTIERVAKFIDLLGYREITLKSDAEPAIIAFRICVADMCRAEVATEDAVQGDEQANGLIESTMMLIRGIIGTIKCHFESSTQEELRDDSPILPWLVEHAGCILSGPLLKPNECLHVAGKRRPLAGPSGLELLLWGVRMSRHEHAFHCPRGSTASKGQFSRHWPWGHPKHIGKWSTTSPSATLKVERRRPRLGTKTQTLNSYFS